MTKTKKLKFTPYSEHKILLVQVTENSCAIQYNNQNNFKAINKIEVDLGEAFVDNVAEEVIKRLYELEVNYKYTFVTLWEIPLEDLEGIVKEVLEG